MVLIDKITVEQARNADLIAFLEMRYGFAFAHHSGGYRCKQHQSLAINSDRRSWYWHSKGVGGFGALDFLMKVENMAFRDAVEAVTGVVVATTTTTPQAQRKALILPEKAGVSLRLYDYLCNKRGIDKEIVSALIQKKHVYQDVRGNIVFAGYDEQEKPRFASLRGTYGDCKFRMDCAGSDKRYSFNMSQSASERLYIFESPIDAMSHATLTNAEMGDKTAWRLHNRLSLAGTSDAALFFFLNKRSFIRTLVFCLDNDKAGREASESMARKYAEMGYLTRFDFPTGKDFNDDLLSLSAANKREQRVREERSHEDR